MSRSLRRELTWRLLLSFILLWGVIGATWYFVVRKAWTAEWDAELAWLAKEACYLLPEGSGLPPLAPSEEASKFSDPSSGLYFEIWDKELLFSDRSSSLDERSLPLPSSFPPEPAASDVRLPDGEPLRLLAQQVRIPLARKDRATARFHVAVARNRSPLDQRLRQLLLTIGTALLGAVLLTVLFIRLSIRRAFRPLQKLEDQIEGIDANSLDQRLELAVVPEEVEPMVLRINDLLQRVSESFERESRFSSDVAHELRTPVAELTALAEVRLNWPERATSGDDQEFLRIGKHMQRQIETLLALARLEQGQRRVAREPIDLGDLVATCWEPIAAKAASRELQVVLPSPPTPEVEGDPDLYAIIVRNLLENAVDYTPVSGPIQVRVRRQEGQPLLLITNEVEDPQALDTKAMFDRFWRADGSRTGEGHSGLGLALCRSSATQMGLKLLASVDETTGFLTIQLVEKTVNTV